MTGGAARPPSLPEPFAERSVVAADDGLELSLYRLREGKDDAPALLWGHANGFPAGGYAPLLRLLASDFRVYAYDARGHGGSGLPDDKPGFDRYAADLDLVCRAVRADADGAPLFYASHAVCGVPGSGSRASRARPGRPSPPSSRRSRRRSTTSGESIPTASRELSGMALRRPAALGRYPSLSPGARRPHRL